MTDSDFVKRAYVAPEEAHCFAHHTRRCLKCFPDENALIYLWCKSYAHSPYGQSRQAHRDATTAELAYWSEQRAIVAWHAERATIELAVDANNPDIIWGFACTSGDTVHYVVIKRVAKERGFFDELLSLLLGDRLQKPCGFTSDLVELRKMRAIPLAWFRDDHWHLRKLIARAA